MHYTELRRRRSEEEFKFSLKFRVFDFLVNLNSWLRVMTFKGDLFEGYFGDF